MYVPTCQKQKFGIQKPYLQCKNMWECIRTICGCKLVSRAVAIPSTIKPTNQASSEPQYNEHFAEKFGILKLVLFLWAMALNLHFSGFLIVRSYCSVFTNC